MKTLLLPLLILVIAACDVNEDPTEVVKEKTYLLHRANYNPTKGTVTIRELTPGKLEFSIQLSNTAQGNEHPAHLHFGSVSEVGELAYRLNPVDGATGTSVTILDQVKLSNGQVLDFALLQQMDGSVKVHMNDNYFKHYVLAFGNIGQNEDYFFDGVAVCTGH